MALPYYITSSNFYSRMTCLPSCQSVRLFQIVCRCLLIQDPQGPSLPYGHICRQVVAVSNLGRYRNLLEWVIASLCFHTICLRMFEQVWRFYLVSLGFAFKFFKTLQRPYFYKEINTIGKVKNNRGFSKNDAYFSCSEFSHIVLKIVRHIFFFSLPLCLPQK